MIGRAPWEFFRGVWAYSGEVIRSFFAWDPSKGVEDGLVSFLEFLRVGPVGVVSGSSDLKWDRERGGEGSDDHSRGDSSPEFDID